MDDNAGQNVPARPQIPDEVRRLQRSLSGFRGHFTRRINRNRRLCQSARANPTPAAAAQLQEAAEEIRQYHAKVIECLEEIQDIHVDATPQETQQFTASLEEIDREFEENLNAILSAIAAINRPPAQPMAAAPVAHQDPVAGRSQPRANDALKPHLLSTNHNPVELRLWVNKFKAWYTSSGFERCPLNEQQAYFKICLDDSLGAKLQDKIHDDTPIFGEGGCLPLLEEQFLTTYPLFSRRMDLFRVVQSEGQESTDVEAKLKAFGQEADLASMTVDELYSFLWIRATTDSGLKEKFLRLESPSLEDLERTARAHEIAKVSLNAETTSSTVNYTGTKPKGPPRFQRQFSKKKKPGASLSKSQLKGKCHRCGRGPHQNPDDCPHVKSTCRICGKIGHISPVCYSGKMSKAHQVVDDQEVEVNTTATINVTKRIGSCPTPRILVEISADTGKSFKCMALPDTGSSRTIISADYIRENGMTVHGDRSEKLFCANGEAMKCEGKLQVKISHQSRQAHVDAIVSSSMKKEVLIAWHDLRTLGIIADDFPNVVLATHGGATHSDAKSMIKNDSLEQIKKDYNDVLSDQLKSTPMAGPPMKIYMKDEEVKPIHVTTTKQIPLYWQEEARETINQLLKDKIIERVEMPTTWISPAFFVAKKDIETKNEGDRKVKSLRLVTNYQRLNTFVKRPIHPFPTSNDIVSNIEHGSKFFCSLDMVKGYHQIELDDESSELTTFLLPYGRFKYRRAPMGLCSSSDEFCRRSDEAIQDLTGVQKIVDDILIHAPSKEILFERIRQVLERCRRHGITVSEKKLQVGTKVKFAGYIVSTEGVKPDPAKLAAIADFPAPTDLSSLRSFMGLANQLGQFVPDLAHMTEPLRALMRKDVAYQWLEEHQHAFDKVKRLLTSDMTVSFFNQKLPTDLLTDASRLKGLGFALVQRHPDGSTRLIQCGSRSLTSTESRYATIELECLGIQYAINKCRHYLTGIEHFNVVTDHKPLLGVFAKPLEDLTNSRLLRLREKLTDFSFTVTWVAGKEHVIADALSRAPVFSHDEDGKDEDTQNPNMVYAIKSQDLKLEKLCDIAKDDVEYQCLVEALKSDVPLNKLPYSHPARLYKSVWHQLALHDNALIIYDDQRILVPRAARSDILKLLHKSHSGVVKTRKAAQQLYFWKSINNDIKQLVESCDECQRLLPSQPIEPLVYTQSNLPFQSVAADLFEYGGKHYLTLVDHYSGYPMVHRLTSLKTSAITSKLLEWFQDYGFPEVFRSDGGPQFRQEFKDFCEHHDIRHELSSPYNSQSNGLAESAVKSMKYLLTKCQGNLVNFRQCLAEWRNTPRADGFSPSQIFFGRRQRGLLPTLPSALKPIDQDQLATAVAKRHCPESKLEKVHPASNVLATLEKGQRVRVQDTKSKKWEQQGVVQSIRATGRSYEIDLDNGSKVLRNRRFIRPI